MNFRFFDELSQNFIELPNDEDDYNVIIVVENKEKLFTAHSNVLKSRSSYFRRELENIQPNENNIKIIIKPNISSQVLNVILQYIYGGIVNLENCETRFIFDLMFTADEFELDELTIKLETLLIETKGSWLRKYFSHIYYSVFNGYNFKKIERFCNDTIVKYPTLIFDADDFTSLKESALVSLLKLGNLQIEEIKIWDYVIKWGIAQTSTLPTNLGEWTKENFLTLKTTLQQCLPHIRYFHLSSIEVVDNIEPFKKILDKQLWKDIKQHLLIPERPVKSTILPPRSVLVIEIPSRAEEPRESFSTIVSRDPRESFSLIISGEPRESFSTIISEEHAAKISTWIDRKKTAYTLTNIPYKFELILRGTRDGFKPKTFWNICHGHAHTIVLVKAADGIIGGYNPLAWDKSFDYNKWCVSKNGFIFSLKNGNIPNSILSRVNDSQHSVLNVTRSWQKYYGPYFGDFYLWSHKSNFTLDNSCFYQKYYYKKLIRSSPPEGFPIINYEGGAYSRASEKLTIIADAKGGAYSRASEKLTIIADAKDEELIHGGIRLRTTQLVDLWNKCNMNVMNCLQKK
ncbi:hypothetical protein Glove_301g13 [Diversispora epigaea]|uniref:BTB domain-containing protein n=1 Tax=Diversispora epigaea TaxID=1348612 RepID=A0A397I296_9GLOM|nr:hypothetical protein Glove_301g13 [Diversispora epigaea]